MEDESQYLEREVREQKKREYVALARELVEHGESLPFPGINPESYSQLKAIEQKYPEYTAPVDELIARLRAQGIKVTFSDDPRHKPEDGNVFIMPFNSDNMWDDNLFPHHLAIIEDMDDKLRKLIMLDIELQKT